MTLRLLQRVLERIRPTPAETLAEMKFARALVRRIGDVAPKGCRAVLTGSVAKGTFLRDSRDLDIFVLFPHSFPKEGLEPAIENILREAFPGTGYRLSYAEHPYARFHYNGRRIDLVPAYVIKDASERVSAVDRSVLHTKYVTSSMKAGQRDGVLLLKRLLKSNGLYGAEIKTEGFSGYLCELLIIEYGSFQSLLRAASRWKLPIFIDPKGHYRKAGKKGIAALHERFSSGFVVIDPTDRERNVAAALSHGNALRFSRLASEFLKKPSEGIFFREPERFDERVARLSKKGHAYVITMLKPDVVDDILWGQLKKMMKQLHLRLVEDGFQFPVSGFGNRWGIIADDSGGLVRVAFAVENAELPEKTVVQGPPLGMLKNVLSFMRTHRERSTKFARKKGRIQAIVRRKVRFPEESLSNFFSYYWKKGKSHLGYPIAVTRVGRAAKR